MPSLIDLVFISQFTFLQGSCMDLIIEISQFPGGAVMKPDIYPMKVLEHIPDSVERMNVRITDEKLW